MLESLQDPKMRSPQSSCLSEASASSSLLPISLPNPQSYDHQLPATNIPSGRDHAPTQCQFLDLPAEIRNKIYGYIVDGFEKKAAHSSNPRSVTSVKGVFAQLPKTIRGLLRTCKKIWLELLSLLFGSYLWAADLLLRSSPPGQIRTQLKESWLITPSTVLHPTSNNIRHVNFRIKETITRAGTKQWVQSKVDISLNKRPHKNAYSTLVSASVKQGHYAYIEDKTDRLKQILEQRIDMALKEVIQAKAESRKSVTSFTVEEWYGLAMHIKSAYLA